MSVCLSVFSVCLSIYLSVSLSSLCMFFCLSVYISVCLSYICLSLCLSIYLSFYLSIYLSFSLSVCLSVFLSVCLCLSIYLSFSLSICLIDEVKPNCEFQKMCSGKERQINRAEVTCYDAHCTAIQHGQPIRMCRHCHNKQHKDIGDPKHIYQGGCGLKGKWVWLKSPLFY